MSSIFSSFSSNKSKSSTNTTNTTTQRGSKGAVITPAKPLSTNNSTINTTKTASAAKTSAEATTPKSLGSPTGERPPAAAKVARSNSNSESNGGRGGYKMNGRVLKPAQLAVYQEAFNLFDKDGEGKISPRKLGSVMRRMGLNPSDAELADMINEVDINKNGTIEFFEFLDMLSSKVLNEPYAEFKAAFELFDKDGNGYIDKEELRAGLKSIDEELGDQDIDLIWRHADNNKDGWICFEEFLRMMTL